jgi:hypothetical protein
MKKLVLISGGIAFVIFLVIGLSIKMNFKNYRNSALCEEYEEFKSMSYQGLVNKKYMNSSEHMNKKNDINANEIDIDIDLDNSGLYDFIILGDSIDKASDSNIVSIFRNSTKIATFEIDFGYIEN